MEISKSSWHYRLINSTIGKPSNSLCLYFWSLIISLLMRILVAFIFVTWVLMMLITISPILIGYNDEYLFLYILGILPWVVTLLILGDYLHEKFPQVREKHFLKKNRREQLEKEPHIVVEYVKAIKNKVCPILDFKE